VLAAKLPRDLPVCRSPLGACHDPITASVDQGLVADRGPDPQPRLVQAALERGLADADDLCGLLGRKAFDVSQHDGRPVIRRQFGQGLAQRLARLYLLEPPKRRHVTRGTVRQVLVYDGDRCVGWCQFGSPPELPNINNRRTYDQGAGDPPDWRIGCIFTGAKDRGKGVAAAAVAGALNEFKRAGGGVIEAYPEQTEQRPPQRGAYLHTGPEELYARYGFTRVRKIA
jgi:hypothetical protein